MAHCSLHFLGSGGFLATATWVTGIIGECHHAQLIFVFLVETGFPYVGQASLELLASGDSPAPASQSAGITDVSHILQKDFFFLFLFFFCLRRNLALLPGWSAVVESELIATATSEVQVILLPQPPK